MLLPQIVLLLFDLLERLDIFYAVLKAIHLGINVLIYRAVSYTHLDVYKRQGVLLHITSLPGRFGTGTLGAPAQLFLDFLADAGFTAWQILPVNPLGEGFSPYQSPASLGINPLLLDPDILVKNGLLLPEELPACTDPEFVDYSYIAAEWDRMLMLATARSGEPNFAEAEFYRQWSSLQAYAHARGIEIIGDLPIYVAPNLSLIHI